MGKLLNLPISEVRPNKVALRQVNRQAEDYLGLVASIRERGFIGAISVRQKTDEATKQPYYELIDGLHRYSAALDVGLKEISCDIIDLTDSEVLLSQIMMNVHKIETRPVEYTRQLIRILQANPLMTEAELATSLGKGAKWISDRLSLTNIGKKEIEELVNAGKITLSNAYALAKLPPDEQPEWVDRALTMSPTEFLPAVQARVKAIREARRQGKDPNKATFEPHPFFQSSKDVRNEAGVGDDKNLQGKIARALADELKIPEKKREAWLEGFGMGTLWTIHLDPKSIEAQKQRDELQKAEIQKRKDEAKAKREAAKAAAAAVMAADANPATAAVA